MLATKTASSPSWWAMAFTSGAWGEWCWAFRSLLSLDGTMMSFPSMLYHPDGFWHEKDEAFKKVVMPQGIFARRWAKI